ncbi:hypothetical protein NCAS_0C05720 [Naumovozyma castellii]|uniref:Uncharacterized protein n=1 Tax=Naumovozyma castellii TaxID=27288 RepID=G0VDK0_NAUCA|nr:hypothetical protein NCAS_0C05720 [Naumovozyma castellii CBS 4309]CCC69562.1 hypothetical protein NCAS_0C05720 [Naumovozyma castellii CBS 4309]
MKAKDNQLNNDEENKWNYVKIHNKPHKTSKDAFQGINSTYLSNSLMGEPYIDEYDADILSNTSSDDSVDYTYKNNDNPFSLPEEYEPKGKSKSKQKKGKRQYAENVNSFDWNVHDDNGTDSVSTITGSKQKNENFTVDSSYVPRPLVSTSASVSTPVPAPSPTPATKYTKHKPEWTEESLKMKKKQLPLYNERGTSYKTSTVIILTSIISILLCLGGQRLYMNYYHSRITNNRFYDSIDLRNYESSMHDVPHWSPSGKFYVDFDQHVAYPIKGNDLIGWRKYKTDAKIFWHRTKNTLESNRRLQGSVLHCKVISKLAWNNVKFASKKIHKGLVVTFSNSKKIGSILCYKYQTGLPYVKKTLIQFQKHIKHSVLISLKQTKRASAYLLRDFSISQLFNKVCCNTESSWDRIKTFCRF